MTAHVLERGVSLGLALKPRNSDRVHALNGRDDLFGLLKLSAVIGLRQIVLQQPKLAVIRCNYLNVSIDCPSVRYSWEGKISVARPS